MTWCKHLFNAHGRFLKDHATAHMTLLRSLQKNVTFQQSALAKLSHENSDSLLYLKSILERCPEPALGGAL